MFVISISSFCFTQNKYGLKWDGIKIIHKENKNFKRVLQIDYKDDA